MAHWAAAQGGAEVLSLRPARSGLAARFFNEAVWREEKLRWRSGIWLLDGERISVEARARAYGQGPEYLFCPHYLQPWFPQDDISLCRDCLLTSSDLLQDGWANPYRIFAERVRQLDESATERWRAAITAAAYALVNRQAAIEDIAWTLFMRQRYVRANVLATLAIRAARRLLPGELTAVTASPGEVAVDLRVQTRATYRSAASPRQIILTAARRGLRGVAVADKNTVFGWREAEIVADRLKREGAVPRDFRVIPAETVRTGAGPVVVLFVRNRLPDGMTAAEVVREAHEQGGVALLAYPGEPGRSAALRRVGFDGFIVGLRPFDMWRGLRLMSDAKLAGLPGLYASGATMAEGVGLPYSTIAVEDSDPEAMAAAMRRGEAYAACALALPMAKVVTSGAVGAIEDTVGKYFEGADAVMEWLAGRLGADFVTVRTSWDDNFRAMMDLLDLPAELRDIADGSSDLARRPRLLGADVEWGPVRLRWRRHPTRVMLQTALTW